MPIYFYLLIFIISFLVIAKSSALLVQSLTHMARFFGLSEYFIAFIFMSIATSMPEFFIGISSTIQNTSSLSFGNILGANLINLTLVIGVVALLSKGITVESKISKRNFLLIFFIAFLPILLISDGVISRGDGIILLVSFIIYSFMLIGEREYFTKILKEVNFNGESIFNAVRNLWRFFLGVSLLIGGSFILVWSGKTLAGDLNIGLIYFGIIFIALGTALPELMFGIRASLMKHSSMTLGNSLGSIAFNSTFILGIMAIIRPIYFTPEIKFIITAFFLFSAFLLFNFFAYSRSTISRREGFMLILVYVAFLTAQYLV